MAARVKSRQSSPSRNRNSSRTNKKGGSSPALYIVIAVCVLAIVGGLIWWLLTRDGGGFQRKYLDKYVEVTAEKQTLQGGASVYFDMSDGMLSAYSTPQSQKMLQDVIDKMAAEKGIDFYGLADLKIEPIQKSHTDLYNYMLSPSSYEQQKAPIEATLKAIVEKKQPALLMTDFEEYKGGVIEHAAYAKKYFIDWLAMGYNIYFYKWDFVEKGKSKRMFMTVFDDNANALNGMVLSAIKLSKMPVDTFVLGGRDFAYPMNTTYLSLKQGGTYHDDKGQDLVTAVREEGDQNSYHSYARPQADATEAEKFVALNWLVGTAAEYYPIGVTWTDAVNNAKAMQEEGIPAENLYTHLLSNFYVDFKAQSGYTINEVEVRVFNMQPTMDLIAAKIENGEEVVEKDVEGIKAPEVNMFLVAGMENARLQGYNYEVSHIYVDFDEKFTGTFMGNIPPTDLFRANLVISGATPNIDEADDFFYWEGNPSLANSVKQTLQAGSSNPEGRILMSYYLKTVQ